MTLTSAALKELNLNPRDNIESISDNLYKLCNFLANQSYINISTLQCKEFLYASLLIHSYIEILQKRNYNLDNIKKEILKNNEKNYIVKHLPHILTEPIQYCALKILEATNGEKFITEILNVINLIFPKNSDKKFIGTFQQNLITNQCTKNYCETVIVDDILLQNKIEVFQLLSRMAELDAPDIYVVIHNIVAFVDPEFTFEYLMHVLLIKREDYGYKMSCYIYRHLIERLKDHRYKYIPLFWSKLNIILKTRDLANMFLECVKLVQFYECITSIIIDYLSQVQRYIDEDEEYMWSVTSIDYKGINIADVSKIVGLLLSSKSYVRNKFNVSLQNEVNDIKLKEYIFQFGFLCDF